MMKYKYQGCLLMPVGVGMIVASNILNDIKNHTPFNYKKSRDALIIGNSVLYSVGSGLLACWMFTKCSNLLTN